MKVNYVSDFAMPWLASYRLRIKVPMDHLKCESVLSPLPQPGFDVYVFGKHAEEHQQSIKEVSGLRVFDVCDLHDTTDHAEHYAKMIAAADVVTCPTESMQKQIREIYAREAVIIPDPWEAEEHEPVAPGKRAVWFGHYSNMGSLDFIRCEPELESFYVVTNVKSQTFGHIKVIGWTAEEQKKAILGSNIVFLPTEDSRKWRVKSPNRVLESLRYGRFVVAGPHIESYAEFSPHIFRGDIQEGFRWANANRQKALEMVRAGQAYIRERYSPAIVADKWLGVFNDKRRADLRQETRQLAA